MLNFSRKRVWGRSSARSFRNVGVHSSDRTVLYPMSLEPARSPPWEPHISDLKLRCLCFCFVR